MNILVIGDIMIDINYNSVINRKAPEANIPIYNINDVNYIFKDNKRKYPSITFNI